MLNLCFSPRPGYSRPAIEFADKVGMALFTFDFYGQVSAASRTAKPIAKAAPAVLPPAPRSSKGPAFWVALALGIYIGLTVFFMVVGPAWNQYTEANDSPACQQSPDLQTGCGDFSDVMTSAVIGALFGAILVAVLVALGKWMQHYFDKRRHGRPA